MRLFLLTWLSACLVLPAAVQAKENSAARTAAPVHKVAARHVTAASAPKTAGTPPLLPAPKAAARHVASVDRAQQASAARAKRAARATSALHRKQATAQAATRNAALSGDPRHGPGRQRPIASRYQCRRTVWIAAAWVNYVYRDVHNVKLPRTSRELAQLKGPKVARGDLKPATWCSSRPRSAAA